MIDAIFYLLIVLALAAVLFGALFVAQKQLAAPGGLRLFGTKPERRIGVVEHVSVDGKRRLILIKRDDVEHLIMTGGPVDIVIETGIVPQSRPIRVADDDDLFDDLPATPYSRPEPTLGETPREA